MFPLLCLLIFSVPFPGTANAESDANGYHKYFTRPDIVSPRWNVTIYDESKLAPGYWFVAPYEMIDERTPGGAWIGPHIYDQLGGLIWSGSYLFNNTNIMDFKLSNVKGNDSLTMIHATEGLGYIFDKHYEQVDQIALGITGEAFNMHEFNFVGKGATLLSLKRSSGYASKEASQKIGFDGQCHVTFEGFEVTRMQDMHAFTWLPHGTIGLEESTVDSTPENRCKGDAWDYIDLNAVDRFKDGHYLLSARNTDTLYKVSNADGSIIWRLGGRYSDFEPGNWNFTRQHHARILQDKRQNSTHTYISVLDNAKGADAQPSSNHNSRGLVIALRTDTNPMTAELVAQYDHPDGPGNYAESGGSLQLLENKNAFISWSDRALQSEHTMDGTKIMEARVLPSGIATYRAFKYEFVGSPKQPPDVASKTESIIGQTNNSTRTRIYVSWNGATDVKYWIFYKSSEDGKTQVRIGSRPRTGFETSLEWNGYASYVAVEAVDKTFRSLGSSRVFKTEEPENMDAEDVQAEIQWQIDAGLGLIHPAGTIPPTTNAFSGNSGSFVAAFSAGLLFTPISFFILRWVWKRRVRSPWLQANGFHAHRSDQQQYSHDYNETTLNDLEPKGRPEDKLTDHFDLTDDDEDDEQSTTEHSRLNARIPYARQASDLHIPR